MEQSCSRPLETSQTFPPTPTHPLHEKNSSSQTTSSSGLYVTFKVLQLVSAFRQRLKTRVRPDRPSKPSEFANGDFCQEFERRSFAEVDRYLGRKRFINRNTKTAEDPGKHTANLGTFASPQASIVANVESPNAREVARDRISRLVQELNQDVTAGNHGLSIIAKDQNIFLQRQTDFNIKRLPIKGIAHRLVLIRNLLDTIGSPVGRLPVCRGDEIVDPLFDEQILENLRHLLFCLQDQLLRLLVARYIQLLLKHVEDCQKDRLVRCHEEIFEYPDCKRPLSTTWPWSIRPSLAVIWGVCWMFFDFIDHLQNENRQFDQQGNIVDMEGHVLVPSQIVQQYRSSLAAQSYYQHPSFRGQQTSPVRRGGDSSVGGGRRPQNLMPALSETSYGVGPGSRTNRPSSQPSHSHTARQAPRAYSSSTQANTSNFAQHSPSPSRSESSFNPQVPARVAGDQDLGGLTFPRTTYITSAPPPSHASYSDDAEEGTGLRGWQTSNLGLPPDSELPAETQWPEQSVYYSSHPPSITFSAPQDATTLPLQEPSYNYYPPAHLTPQRSSYMPNDPENMQTPVSPVSAHEPNDSTGDQQQQLSRKRSHSVMSQQDAALQNAINHQSRAASVGSQNALSQGEEFSPRGSRTVKRNDPPMSGGKYVCDFSEECAGQTFDRKCEWSKHMDKHDRPYRCPHPSCAKLQGFTYSGGLLRHEREVHGKHGGPKAQLMCPHPDCKRHTGKGFTRKENLNEHLRRVHAAKDTNSQDPSMARDLNDMVPGADEAETPASLGGIDTTDPALTSPRDEKPGKRTMPPIDEGLEDPEGLGREVKRLRSEVESKDLRIRQLEDALSHFQQYQVSHEPQPAAQE